jgi:hypothetical protein
VEGLKNFKKSNKNKNRFDFKANNGLRGKLTPFFLLYFFRQLPHFYLLSGGCCCSFHLFLFFFGGCLNGPPKV